MVSKKFNCGFCELLTTMKGMKVMKKKIKLIILIILSLQAGNAIADIAADPNLSGDTYVMIVGGVNKDPEQRQAADKAVMVLRKMLLDDGGVAADRLKVLVDVTSFARKNAQISNAENLRNTIAGMAKAVKSNDRFIFYYVGQANIVNSVLRLNLPGKDMTHEELAGELKKIKPAQMLIVLDCPGAGLVVKPMTAKNRIIVCGARSDQPYSPRFSEYFLPALIDEAADTDLDEKVSLLEAFTLTSKNIHKLYEKQELLKTETPLLEDDGDGIPSQEPWQYKIEKNDGLTASKFFLIETEQ
ncbi:MAG: hypothetical protein K9M75_09885 [Phycisphaerae bacterium]|nr:hypothetical protein [Phycisphaerae bacterium]